LSFKIQLWIISLIIKIIIIKNKEKKWKKKC
jgi:hypothetical protein